MGMAALGVYISELRSLRGFTQKQVGDAAGVTDTSVRTWEKGQHEPGAGALIKVLDFLGGAFEDADLLLRSGDEEAGRLLARRRHENAPLSPEERQLLDRITVLQGSRRQAAVQVLRDLLAAEERGGGR